MREHSEEKLYIAVDGDDVGRRLEYYMIINDSTSLTAFSTDFRSSMTWLEDRLIQIFNAKILFSGGDNLLAEISLQNEFANPLSTLHLQFTQKSNNTLSVGVGSTLREAYFALKIAKASGKNCIKVYDGAENG